MAFTNVYACLVHERPDCIADLVRNLRHLDPGSEVLLYNGGADSGLLRRSFAVGGYEPHVHPAPQRLAWGALHPFAVDSMRYALDEIGADAVTVVDSDQLAVAPGYSQRLAAFLSSHPSAGMLGNSPGVQDRATRIHPAVYALREIELWRPFLRRFPRGEEKFPHWTFWPSTVITAAAARDLVRMFDQDAELADVMRRSRIWATEEIVLPTLVALLGHDVVRSPFSYDAVRYRVRYTRAMLDAAMRKPDVMWAHPVPRVLDHELRALVRDRHGGYATAAAAPPPAAGAHPAARPRPRPPLLAHGPVLDRIRTIDGWLSDEEADLLLAAAVRAATEHPPSHATVEVGSYCGRATVALASVARAYAPGAKVVAIDPHDGVVGAAGALQRMAPTLDRFRAGVAAAGLDDHVETVVSRPQDVTWRGPIGFLLIDGLHDYQNAAADFARFEPWLVDGGYVAFHDYAAHWPGVRRLVDELLAGDRYAEAGRAGTMIVLRRTGAVAAGQLAFGDTAPAAPAAPPAHPRPVERAARPRPLVSCVMPTAGRPVLAAQAIDYFLRQDLDDRELVVLDDGPEPLQTPAIADPRVRYVRLDRRLTIGAKRNLGCEEARADLVAHWDDDDWIAPWRLTRQLEVLTREGADVCGLDRLLYFDPAGDRAWRYVWPSGVRPWLSDGTLLYTKDFWRRNPFPDSSMGVDCRFLWNGRPKRVATMPDERFYVGTIHPGNTSRKDPTRSLWTATPVAEVHELLGDDLAFYAGWGGGVLRRSTQTA
jgi:predicted O-methyltransferase YrrM